MGNSTSMNQFLVKDCSYSIEDFLRPAIFLQIKKKFPKVSELTFNVALIETIKFLYLSSYSPSTLFFPGDQLIDDLWHSLIVETADYRLLCDRLRSGSFIDHSGIKYEDYIKTKTAVELHEEQISWLTSYIANFGDISEEAYEHLLLAQTLAARFGVSREELNKIAHKLIDEVAQQSSSKKSSFTQIIEQHLKPNLLQADQSADFANDIIKMLVSSSKMPSPDELKLLFGISPPVAFTFWQHVAAVERLKNSEEWQAKNNNLWRSIEQGTTLVGLGTTHLASPFGNPLTAVLVDKKYRVTGIIPWASGRKLFEKIILGFRTETQTIFALVNFPKFDTEIQQITQHNLKVMNSTDTVSVKLTDFVVEEDCIISCSEIGKSVQLRPSRYWHPELGIAKECLRKIESWVEMTKHPKAANVRIKLKFLKEKVQNIERLEKMSSPEKDSDQTSIDIQNLILTSIRLLILATGSMILKSESEILLLQSQSNLLDIWVQGPDLLNAKINSLGE